jgi:hypothetical protein
MLIHLKSFEKNPEPFFPTKNWRRTHDINFICIIDNERRWK